VAAAEQSAAISGIGQSAVGRRLERDPLDLTIDACLAAIADGLNEDHIPTAQGGRSWYPATVRYTLNRAH
jgi:hypothetical protein